MLAACVPIFSIAVLEPIGYSFFILTAPVGIASAVLAFIPLSSSYLSKLAQKQQFQEDLREFLELKKAERASTTESEHEAVQNSEW